MTRIAPVTFSLSRSIGNGVLSREFAYANEYRSYDVGVVSYTTGCEARFHALIFALRGQIQSAYLGAFPSPDRVGCRPPSELGDRYRGDRTTNET